MNNFWATLLFSLTIAFACHGVDFRGYLCKGDGLKIDLKEYFVDMDSDGKPFDLSLREKSYGKIKKKRVMLFNLSRNTIVLAMTTVGTFSFTLPKPDTSLPIEPVDGIIDYKQTSKIAVTLHSDKNGSEIFNIECNVYDFTSEFFEKIFTL